MQMRGSGGLDLLQLNNELEARETLSHKKKRKKKTEVFCLCGVGLVARQYQWGNLIAEMEKVDARVKQCLNISSNVIIKYW